MKSMKWFKRKPPVFLKNVLFSIVITAIFYIPFSVFFLDAKLDRETREEIAQTDGMAKEISAVLLKDEGHNLDKERPQIEHIISTYPLYNNDSFEVYVMDEETLIKGKNRPGTTNQHYPYFIEKLANLVANEKRSEYENNWDQLSSMRIGKEDGHYICRLVKKLPHQVEDEDGAMKVDHRDTIIIERDLTELYAETIYNGLTHGAMTAAFLLFAVLVAVYLVQYMQFRLVRRVVLEQDELLRVNKYENVGEKHSGILGRVSEGIIKRHIRANEQYVANRNLLQDVSHETASRLTEIKTSVDLIRYYKSIGEEDEEQVNQLLEKISAAAMSIANTQNTFIDLAKVENPESIASVSCYDSQELINIAIVQASNLYPNMDIVKIDGKVHKPVSLQREHFLTVMRTLIENAVKYSHDSSTVEVGLVNNPKYKGHVAIRVTNWGSYIPEEEREKIFERYYRGSHNRQNRTGSGLGLHIVQKIMKLYEGSVEVESDPSGETSFIVIFKEAGRHCEC